jgi:hypothetical protein
MAKNKKKRIDLSPKVVSIGICTLGVGERSSVTL